MLKRQRATSHPPASPSVPQDTPTENFIDIRDLKRRRIIPPSLDGQTRGWDALDTSHPDDENEEEYTEVDAQAEGCKAETFSLTSNVEYKLVNNVLKEIHILHRHRQMFLLSTHPPIPTHGTPIHTLPLKGMTSRPPEEPKTCEESARIYEHYEDTNRSSLGVFVPDIVVLKGGSYRFLALAFLSRRQGNDSS